jgi:hypothetical protein
MKRKLLILTPLALMAFSTSGWTAMADDAEATIRLMEASEAEESTDVTRVISLPEHLLLADPEDQVKAVERAEKGLDNAEKNVNKALPENASDQAREAREAAADMSEKAKENRENRGRSDDRPDRPGRPENPGPPENPGGE